jgi:tetratricopeptide (TPR) repeat protein
MDTGAGWDRVVAAHGISLAVVDYKNDPRSDRGLRAKLRADPEWVCVFCGDNLVVYAHERPKNEEILARFGSSFDPSLRSLESLDAFLREASPEDIERAAAAYGNMTRVAPEEKAPAMLAGRMLDRLGRSDEAAVHFRRVLDIDPASVETRLFLAGALQRSGAVEEARLELDEVLERDPRNVWALIQLGELERSSGHLDAAVAALERAAIVQPGHYVVQLRLGALNGQMGRIDRARHHLDRALQIRPGDPAALRNLEMVRRMQEEQGR